MLAGLAACAFAGAARGQSYTYTIKPEFVADGLWVVRGADEAIGPASGGAIANISILATSAGTVLVDCGPSLRYGKALKTAAEALTGKPVVRVYLTHLHPDHIYGAGAFDRSIVAATPALATLLVTEGAGFSDGMYRLLGDWMRGTEFVPPGKILDADHETFGDRRLDLLALAGHSPADLAIVDGATGTLIAGDLVFHDRAPATPHADLAKWRASLDGLKAVPHRRVIPGHGPVDPTPFVAIDQTRDWLDWLGGALEAAVANGLDAVEAGNQEIPPRFAVLKAARYELQRSVSHFYATIEEQKLPRIDAKAR
jgi:quinoprotein relay system zinc metallohydrolase 1